jgi:hypothetical protein
MDPLSLLCRLATSVPPPRLHTIRYAGVLASASPWRSRLAPQPPQAAAAVDVLACSICQARMKLLALVKGPASISRYLATMGEATEVPRRSPGRGPPYWKSRVLRLKVLGDEDEAGGRGHGAGEEVA